ncbi:hypothetical protein [Citrobacter pasteurii]|nr:hypothetical protein [Citrobacter pasteurii]
MTTKQNEISSTFVGNLIIINPFLNFFEAKYIKLTTTFDTSK